MLLESRTRDRSVGAGDRDSDTAGSSPQRSSRPRRARTAGSSERATRSKAAQRALDRRDRRAAAGSGAVAAITRKRIGGIPLVIPVLLLVFGALGATLYLTTKSAQDSYSIDALRSANQTLSDKRDDLKRTFDRQDSAPELAKKAAQLGMIPSGDASQIVIDAKGKSHLRGTATPAEGRALPDLNPEPSIVAKIDTSKVDDSQGLGGHSAADASDTAPRTSGAPASPVAQLPTQVNSPRPNVLPPSAATPRVDTQRAR